MVIFCSRMCMHRKKINLSTAMAGRKVGIKEVDDHIRLVSFMDCDPGYVDLEQRTLQTIDNPFATRLSPVSQVHSVTPCVRRGHYRVCGCAGSLERTSLSLKFPVLQGIYRELAGLSPIHDAVGAWKGAQHQQVEGHFPARSEQGIRLTETGKGCR